MLRGMLRRELPGLAEAGISEGTFTWSVLPWLTLSGSLVVPLFYFWSERPDRRFLIPSFGIVSLRLLFCRTSATSARRLFYSCGSLSRDC